MCELRQQECDWGGARSLWQGRGRPALVDRLLLEPASGIRGTQEPAATRVPEAARARPVPSGTPAWSLRLDVHIRPSGPPEEA